MFATILSSAVALLAEIAPTLTTSASIAKAINLISVAVPAVISTAQDLYPVVKTAITALQGNAATTPAQIAELDALEAKIDADYDAASKAAGVEDAKAGEA